jgi:hypothetical protein
MACYTLSADLLRRALGAPDPSQPGTAWVQRAPEGPPTGGAGSAVETISAQHESDDEVVADITVDLGADALAGLKGGKSQDQGAPEQLLPSLPPPLPPLHLLCPCHAELLVQAETREAAPALRIAVEPSKGAMGRLQTVVVMSLSSSL